MKLRRLAGWAVPPLLLAGGCDCGGNGKTIHWSPPTITVGDWWKYEEPNSSYLYLDTVRAVGETTYRGVIATQLYSIHAKDTSTAGTTLAFIVNDTFFHRSATTGFMPDTIDALGKTYALTFDSAFVDVAWLPLNADLGEYWNSTYSTGRVVNINDASETYSLEVTLVGELIQLENIIYDADSFGVKDTFNNTLQVKYTANINMGGGGGISLQTTTINWADDVGDVYHWAYDVTPLEQYLVDYSIQQ